MTRGGIADPEDGDARADSPPRSAFVRGTILGRAVARASTTKLKLAIQQPFRPESKRVAATQRADDEMAQILFEACGVLRGTALKLAQVLAMEEELVPPAFRQEFARAAHRAPPISRALARKILQTELGDPEGLFREFAPVPFAAASFGQVHAAEAHSGQRLAVKIQYPGMAESVDSDLRALRALLRPTRFSAAFESCIDELRARLTEELDYCVEAKHTEWFRQHLESAKVRIPAVYERLTTRRVLTTERLTGRHLAEWLALQPTQAERDHYGQLLVDLFNRSVFELGFIHADPNPGNYLFTERGELGLLDFGCVRRLESRVTAAMARVFAATQLSADEIEALHRELGIRYRTNTSRKDRLKFLVEWSELIALPYRSEVFDFGQNQEYFARGDALSRIAWRYLERYEGGFLYVGRAHHGLQRLLQAIGARVRMRSPMAEPCS